MKLPPRSLYLLLGFTVALACVGFEARFEGRGRSSVTSITVASHARTFRVKPRGSDDVLRELEEGNERFLEGRPRHPHCDLSRLHEVAKGQNPHACVLTCADSRVSPELVLDQGLGDLFTIRVAGNVVDPSILGSMEYAVEHLHSELILVLGHSRCGAVKEAVHVSGEPEALEKLGPNLEELIKHIQPAIAALPRASEEELIDAGVHANAKFVADEVLHRSAVLREANHRGAIAVVAAVYDLETGRVEFLMEEPH